MVETTADKENYFLILHLGAQDSYISDKSYKRKKQLLKRALQLPVENGDFA